MPLLKRRDKSNDLWLSENEVMLLCFINGEGGQQVNLNKNLSLDLLSIVIPQHSIEKLIEYNAQVFDSFSAFTQCQDNTHLFLKGNRPVEKTVIKAANDLNQARFFPTRACLDGWHQRMYPQESLQARVRNYHLSVSLRLSHEIGYPLSARYQYVYGRYRHQVGV